MNSSTAQAITHVLLFDGDEPQLVQNLCDNTRLVSNCYRQILNENSDSIMELKYRVVIAVQENSSLAPICEAMSSELKSEGISATVVNVKAEDMFMSQGKVGLLSCVLWCIGGSLLLNEVLITKENAEKLLYQANKFDYNSYHLILIKQGWFKEDV